MGMVENSPGTAEEGIRQGIHGSSFPSGSKAPTYSLQLFALLSLNSEILCELIPVI